MSICSPKLTVNELHKFLSKIKDEYGDYELAVADDGTGLMILSLIDEDVYIIQGRKKIYMLGRILG